MKDLGVLAGNITGTSCFFFVAPSIPLLLADSCRKMRVCVFLQQSGAGEPPQFWKKNAPRIWAEMLASNQFRESLRELLRE